jgi:amylosucrase
MSHPQTLPTTDEADLLARLDRWLPDLRSALGELYGAPEALLERVVGLAVDAHRRRPQALRDRDRARVLQPDWFQLPSCVGYAAYADRFAGTLRGVADRVPYLSDLGVTYLHLMPLLQPRPAPNDGGYAVTDYRQVRSDLGDMDDLRALAARLHEDGISLTLDLVLNHVAREHPWAVAARAGDLRYRGYFHLFADRTEPDRYERTLPEVFPDFAPGSFSWDPEAAAWVWTTFNSWQWDLDWSNPDVLCEFVEIVLFLANAGVDCLRLDAIAFLWKRLGTSCQNEPEVHAITQALRAVAHIAAPSLVFKAEAIVGPQQVVAYLGTGTHAGKVSDLAYHNSLMVQLWSALATRDARMLVRALERFPAKPTTTAWATYVRCHDDIGWAVDDRDAAAVGWDGPAHRSFLSDFYAGLHPGSFARGVVFQANPETGDRRISGTAASLAGVEQALADADPEALTLALDRLTCVHALALGFGGPPLIYMGDELALTNDYRYSLNAEHADDNRWLHRPAMPWGLADERLAPQTVAGHVAATMFRRLQHLVRVRTRLAALHASIETTMYETGDPAVVSAVRRHPAGVMVQLYNLADRTARVPRTVLTDHGLAAAHEHLSGTALSIGPDGSDGLGGPDGPDLEIPPYAAWWLTAAP